MDRCQNIAALPAGGWVGGGAGRKWSHANLTQRLSSGGVNCTGSRGLWKAPAFSEQWSELQGLDVYRPTWISSWPGVCGHWFFLRPWELWLKSILMHLASLKYKLFSIASNFKGILGTKWEVKVLVDFTCMLYTNKSFICISVCVRVCVCVCVYTYICRISS